jgi:hypothetical protein
VYLFYVVDWRKNGFLDLCDGAATIFHVACKKLLHLLLTSLLVFLKRLVDFFQRVIERAHDDVLVVDLRSSYRVKCLGLDLTKYCPQRSHQKVC